MMNRAYSLLTLKAVDEDKRILKGIATTPTADLCDDIVEPKGAEFSLPIPFLWQHDSERPVGHVTKANVTKDGIQVEIQLQKIDEPGTVKDRLDAAWQDIKLGLVRGLSIGFQPVETSRIEGSFGTRFLRWIWLELSGVTVAANSDCSIQTIKAIDSTAQRAATGQKLQRVVTLDPPGASGSRNAIPKPQEGNTMKTLAEQITALETKRAANIARMEAVMQKSADEGQSSDAASSEEFDTLEAEVETIDKDLARFRKLEKAKAVTAKPVIAVSDEKSGIDVRSGIVVKAQPKLDPGIGFARFTKCMALAAKMYRDPAVIAAELYGEDSVVVGALKTAVGASTAVSGSGLVGAETTLFADFVEFLRPKTIIGQFGTNGIPSLRNVPFRTALLTQTSAGAGYWVGQGKAKPLTHFDYSRTTLEPLKVANIAVLTEENIRDSSPKSDALVRDELAKALMARLDTDFIDPNKTASANVSPASITNGARSIASTGTDGAAVRLDIRALFDIFDTADNPAEDAVLIMSPRNARGLSSLRTTLDQAFFPNVSVRGGSVDGTPVISSRFVDEIVVLVNASDIYLGDEGGVSVDMSREASLEMSDAPAHDSSTPTPAQLVSMFQTNSVAIRAERTINWKRRRTSSVVYLTGALWGGDLPTV